MDSQTDQNAIAELKYQEALSYARGGDLQTARTIYREAAEVHTTHSTRHGVILTNLGLVEYKLGNKEEGIALHWEALKYFPGCREIYGRLRMALTRKKDFGSLLRVWLLYYRNIRHIIQEELRRANENE